MPLIKQVFSYTGTIQTFTIPQYATEVLIKAWGAGAGGGGGPGGYTTGRTPVVAGDTLRMTVGQGGQTNQTTSTFGGGGGTTANTFDPTIVGASGGGASYLYKNVSTLLLVAGGGGGGGSAPGFSYGGSGGGLTGTTAPNLSTTNTGGGGGTQVAGGAGGVNSNSATFNGTAGSSLQGGRGGGTNGTNAGTAGGGGGGYFGGGGGSGQQSQPTSGQQETAGGGGSSYIAGVLGGSTQSTPQNTTGAAASFLPPNTTDPDYITNVGIGRAFPGFGPISVGGNGLIVLSYTLPDLVLNKSVNQVYSDINNTLTYTISVRNTGPSTVTNVTFVDTIPNGTTFVSNSLSIDGVPSSNNPAPPGFTIASLGNGITTTITYSVRVGSNVPSPNPVLNVASATYPNSSAYSSNVVSTTINHATISASKIVSKNYANVGDVLTYTIPLRNNGSTTATNVLFIDTIPNGTSLVGGSFRQDGNLIAGSPNPPGVTLPNAIGAGAISTIVFQVTVTTIPSPNPIVNIATASYSYTINPASIPNIVSGGATITNSVSTQVNNANLDNIVKGVDKAYAKIGDVLTYTITIPNRGSTTATNVIFKDTIPSGTSFVANSVILNGVEQSGLVVAPPTGLNIGTIAPNTTVTLSFQVTVTTIPSPNPIPNSGNVGYSYTVDPVVGTTATGSNNTNVVSTTISSAVINSTKSVTPTNTTVGETIFYTIVLTNTGNVTANNVIFIDTIPNDTTFESGSVDVNGTNQPTFNPAPPNGFAVSDIAPNGRTTITFRVSVNTIPNPNPIQNSSNTRYTYTLNPTTGETVAKTSLSNIVLTSVNPDSNPLKIADKQYAKPGDIITYTVQWQNRLNVTATDVTFIDTIPNDTTFISNSFTIDGTTISGANPTPPTGVNVGTVASGAFTTVTFQVTVNTIPNPNPIPNQAIGRYSYISDPTLSIITTETAASNTVTTQVNSASIPSANKSVDKAFAKVGDILTYTISFTNTGNTTATNVVLIDTIPNGTTFNINSVFLNGTNVPGGVVAPPTGLSVGSLGANNTATVVFTVLVNTVPSPNPIPNTANVGYDYIINPITSRTDTGGTNTNTVNTTVNFANLGIIGKSVDKTFANIGDTITYTITVQNTGNVTSNNTLFVDTIPNDTTFQSGSVLINGVSTATVPTGNILRVNMGNIAPGGTSSLTFKVNIDRNPTPNPIPNSANASYTYTVDPASPNGQSGSNNTNIVNTQVNSASLGGITKFVDKLFVTCGDIITYTISIPNSGNITATNVLLSDTLPNGTVFVPNSILVNGASSSATSPISVPLGSINPGATATVSFQVQIQC